LGCGSRCAPTVGPINRESGRGPFRWVRHAPTQAPFTHATAPGTLEQLTTSPHVVPQAGTLERRSKQPGPRLASKVQQLAPPQHSESGAHGATGDVNGGFSSYRRAPSWWSWSRRCRERTGPAAGVNATLSNRMSVAEWTKCSDWCGHQHVPGESQWDPDAIDIGILLN
jgi:hypothetical protein